MDPGGLKFWAFVSYSHRDGKVASAVQRALESYRLPSRLVGRPTPFGPAPRSLEPVFRDREELQASADLDATVREALAQSRHLVVLCSPDSARSAWVNREIVEFKKLHGDSRVEKIKLVNIGYFHSILFYWCAWFSIVGFLRNQLIIFFWFRQDPAI